MSFNNKFDIHPVQMAFFILVATKRSSLSSSIFFQIPISKRLYIPTFDIIFLQLLKSSCICPLQLILMREISSVFTLLLYQESASHLRILFFWKPFQVVAAFFSPLFVQLSLQQGKEQVVLLFALPAFSVFSYLRPQVSNPVP